MKIVPDTTVFAHGFNSASADVRLLKNFLDHGDAELCVPAVVLEEAVNLVRKSIEDVNHRLNAAQRLTGDDQTYSNLDVREGLTRHRGTLHVLLKSLKARILPYPSVGHEDLVAKALKPNKPFVSSGRGYRDALIWYSVLDLAQSCHDEVSFISDNSDDWCRSKKDLRLHDDLLTDLKSRGIDTSRIRFFASLGDFIQQCAIGSLPVTAPAGDTATSPDYQQLLIDGKEWIETLLVDKLPEYLRSVSRADARAEGVEVLDTSAPRDIRPFPIRTIDDDRRVLQFSAKYVVALQFIIRKSDVAVWSQRLSLHLRQEWDDLHFRVQATTTISVLFHMIERGENTEAFSVVSISPAYYAEFLGTEPVAIKLHQTMVHAPQHTNWGTVKCDNCGEEFAVGCHAFYPTGNETECVERLHQILATDHSAGRGHENLYELTR